MDALAKTSTGLKNKKHVILLARLMIRCALLLTKKEGKGRESKVFGSLQAITEAFYSEWIELDQVAGSQAAQAAGIVLQQVPAAGSCGAGPGEDETRVLDLKDLTCQGMCDICVDYLVMLVWLESCVANKGF